jgi:hypothetical protein
MRRRHRITPEFVADVNERLLRAGRVLCFACSSYGVVLTSAVQTWSRLQSKRASEEIEGVGERVYDFRALALLLNIKRWRRRGWPPMRNYSRARFARRRGDAALRES